MHEKTFLAQEFLGDNHIILEASGLELHSSSTEPVICLRHNPHFGRGTIVVWRCTGRGEGGARPQNAPRA